jgi:hypothetical protein
MLKQKSRPPWKAAENLLASAVKHPKRGGKSEVYAYYGAP